MNRTRTATQSRTYPSSSQAVWKAWTDPTLLSTWHGCGPDQLWTVHEWDVRVGGRLHVSMEMFGEPFDVEGEFHDVEEASLIRYTFGDGVLITVTIEESPEGTRVQVEHAGLPNDEMHGIVIEGWTSSLQQLADALGE